MLNNNDVLLKVEDLCQYFKMGRAELKAVDNVSFEVKKGEVFGLVGESGCGKTTTGRSIIKLYDITSGNIYFKGKRICAGTKSYTKAIKNAKEAFQQKVDAAQREGRLTAELKQQYKKECDEIIEENKLKIKQAKFDHVNCDALYKKEQVALTNDKYNKLLEGASPDQRASIEMEYKAELKKASTTNLVTQIQMIFQDPIASLNPRMTVREIISEGLVIQGVKDKEFIDKKVFEVLDLVGLVPEHAGRYPHEFSGGQRQRIGVARSIIMNPELIIADEPVSALDVSIQAQVINLLNDLREKLGLTILFIAHDLSVVKYFSDRIGVMYFGKLVELATAEELFKNPLHPYTKSLLSAIPLPDPNYEKQRKRIIYNPLAEHDYSEFKPELREVSEGHFVYCNQTEFENYLQQIK